MSETQHALLSASGAHRWAVCAPSLRLEAAFPNSSSKYASEGTAAHELGSWALYNGKHPSEYPETHIVADDISFPIAPMVEPIGKYVDLVRKMAVGGTLLVEQRVDFSSWIDVPDSFGTSDTVILFEDRCVVIDLKYGMGVKVDAEENEQLMLYALGALYEYEMLGDFQSVTVVICQPRLDHVDEWTVSVADLKTFALKIRAAARTAINALEASVEPSLIEFTPDDHACRFCRAKATCPALRAEVETETRDFFAPMLVGDTERERLPAEIPDDQLGRFMDLVDRFENFCKAVRAETERRLLFGLGVPSPKGGYKLVGGRRGPRAWSDPDQAETMLRSFRLRQEEMYSFALLSPTAIEKELATKNPKRWAKLQALVTQTDGKPSVAPMSDKRPALVVSSVDETFASLANGGDLV